MVNSIFIFWVIINALLLVYILQELMLTFAAFRAKKTSQTPQIDVYHMVTVQLPLYNEPFVVQRLLEACVQLNYPDGLLEIQILDDSTDQTSEIIQTFIVENAHYNYPIVHVQRSNRAGYKAGALAHGMKSAKGEFIAIFDADFLPDPDFLLKTIPHFQNNKIGVVQTRWGHINEKESLLTRAQAIMLNTHFSVEQLGRTAKKAYINFNGTAGVWRKTCINEAGGWEADTLTEDLDLSYRAQMKNWQFKYLFDVNPIRITG